MKNAIILLNFWENTIRCVVINLEPLYIYFENYYFSEKNEEKDAIFEKFSDIFWKSTPNFKKYKTKYGWSCRLMTVEDEPETFLRNYINYLFAKYCCKETWPNHSKFEYDYKKFKIVVNYYLRKIFNNYIPVNIYEKNNGGKIQISVNDLYGEDGYVVKYVTNSLRGYFLNRIKRHLTGKYIECSCGEQVLKNSNNQVMCKRCGKEKELKRQREKWRKNKEKYRCATALENSNKPLSTNS